MSIPITVGVTGHRDLRTEDLPKLRELVHSELLKLQKLCPDSEFAMISSLAAGADSLCAEEALKLGFKLICPLPVSQEIYQKDFSPEELVTFKQLLLKADKVFVAPDVEPYEESRRHHFRQAGIYVASHSHVLLALWDGSPAKKGGCGTAEAVDFILHRSYENGTSPFAEKPGAVIHINLARASQSASVRPSAKLLETEDGVLLQLLKETNEYNKDCKRKIRVSRRSLINTPQKSDEVKTLEQCNAMAAALSRHFQKKYFRSLAAMSFFCVLLVMSYLFYDSGEFLFMLPVYAGVLVLYFVLYRWIMHGKYHEKYIRYRMLAESLRVQTFISALDLRENVADYYTWSVKRETLWIHYAIDVLRSGIADVNPDETAVQKYWIEDQLNYHRKAFTGNHHKDIMAERISAAMLISTVVLFVIVFVLEYTCIDFMLSYWLGILWRDWLKILWGTLSAVALFVSGYYGNLSLNRKQSDNQKMITLFDTAYKRIADPSIENKPIYLELAREEIIENGSWASYCKEDKPMFSL